MDMIVDGPRDPASAKATAKASVPSGIEPKAASSSGGYPNPMHGHTGAVFARMKQRKPESHKDSVYMVTEVNDEAHMVHRPDKPIVKAMTREKKPSFKHKEPGHGFKNLPRVDPETTDKVLVIPDT